MRIGSRSNPTTCRSLSGVMVLFVLLSLSCAVSWAGTFTIGGADGSFVVEKVSGTFVLPSVASGSRLHW